MSRRSGHLHVRHSEHSHVEGLAQRRADIKILEGYAARMRAASGAYLLTGASLPSGRALQERLRALASPEADVTVTVTVLECDAGLTCALERVQTKSLMNMASLPPCKCKRNCLMSPVRVRTCIHLGRSGHGPRICVVLRRRTG